MKEIIILGSTGSIGKQTLEVVNELSGQYKVTALVANTSGDLLIEQAEQFSVPAVGIRDHKQAQYVQQSLPGVDVYAGDDGILDIVKSAPADVVVAAIVGAAGLKPTLAALERGCKVALANKEVLVACGHLLAGVATSRQQMVPVDSEHSAIFQCLEGWSRDTIDRIWLTASGGPFRTQSKEDIMNATPEQALSHPRWDMGPKISIDSATMMNKGLEMIEAKWLFDLTWDQIEVVIHKQSIVHSLVEFVDGSMLAQLSPPDMRLPIAIALSYPDRCKVDWPRLDLSQTLSLDFEPPDEARFPSLKLARECGQAQGLAPAVMNAANEQAVELFLHERIKLDQITDIVARVVDAHKPETNPDLDQILAADRWARIEAARLTETGVSCK